MTNVTLHILNWLQLNSGAFTVFVMLQQNTILFIPRKIIQKFKIDLQKKCCFAIQSCVKENVPFICTIMLVVFGLMPFSCERSDDHRPWNRWQNSKAQTVFTGLIFACMTYSYSLWLVAIKQSMCITLWLLWLFGRILQNL